MNRRRLCLIHMADPLAQAFQDLGHEVLALHPAAGTVLDLPAELSRRGFSPDIVIQQELLAARTLLAGLEGISAVRVFWALDPHLNAFWQAPYARLFDLVFSTQRRNIPDLKHCGADSVLHLPWFSPARPFRPFAERPREIGFVGRLGPTRPVRGWLVAFLSELLPGRFEAVADIPFDAMLDFTQATRLIPNESITGEVNFRLFEAAGQGCVVLAQDLGPEQAELFEPGREILVCADALELADTAGLLSQRPRLAEALGRAAWERAQADHLPAARAARMLDEAQAAARNEYSSADARRWLTLALAGLFEAGRLAGGGEAVARDLTTLQEQDARVLEARLRSALCLSDANEVARTLETSKALLSDRGALASEALSLCLACSMLALRQALDEPAKAAERLEQAWRWAGRAGLKQGPGHAFPPVDLLLAWARRAQEAGLPLRAGFGFDAARHLPANATECLFLAQALVPADMDMLRAVLAHLDGLQGVDVLRLGVLSELGLRAPGDWRVGLAAGLCNLRAFRPEAGLSELALAARAAGRQGEAEAFALALAEADPSGRIRRALERCPS